MLKEGDADSHPYHLLLLQIKRHLLKRSKLESISYGLPLEATQTNEQKSKPLLSLPQFGHLEDLQGQLSISYSPGARPLC